MLNRDGLAILLHPETGNDYADHAVWFGAVLPLRLDVLRGVRTASAATDERR
jgi:aromatic ring-cleaving dioxygenase